MVSLPTNAPQLTKEKWQEAPHTTCCAPISALFDACSKNRLRYLCLFLQREQSYKASILPLPHPLSSRRSINLPSFCSLSLSLSFLSKPAGQAFVLPVVQSKASLIPCPCPGHCSNRVSFNTYTLMSSSAQASSHTKPISKMAAPKNAPPTATTTAAEAKAVAAKMHRRSRSGAFPSCRVQRIV